MKSKILLVAFLILSGMFYGGCRKQASSEPINTSLSTAHSRQDLGNEPAQTTVNDELLNRARNLQSQGRAKEALLVYESLLAEKHPESVEIHRSMAQIAMGLKRYKEAVSHYESLLQLEPRDARGQFALASVLIDNLKSCDNGLQAAILAKESFGSDGLEYTRDLLIGRAYDCLNNRDQAIIHYKAFIKGASFAPESEVYRRTVERVSQLEARRSNP